MRADKKLHNPTNAAGHSDVLTSRLLPEVFAPFQPGDSIRVLDLGAGSADTVRYLSQYQARISFVDMLDHDALATPSDDTLATSTSSAGSQSVPNPAQALSLCTQILNLPRDAKFDVILIWDVVHHLSVPMLEALSSVLEAHTLKHTRGYGFGSLQADRVHEPFHYGVFDHDQIAQAPADVPVYSAHSQQQMNQKFLCMHISKATLLQEGKLELLFEHH